MTDVTIDAGTLTANKAERIVTGLLLPFGEECRSNLGKFTFDAGVVSIPADLSGMSFNVEHAREDIIGSPVTLSETSSGIVASFKIAATPEGDAALEDIASGKRKHLSAEVSGVKIKDGKGIAGRLFAAALVAEPAFPSATLLAAAVDTDVQTPVEDSTPDLEPDADGDIAIAATATPSTVTVTADDTVTTFVESEAPVPEATIPDTLHAGAVTSPRPLSAQDVGALLYARREGRMSLDDFSEAIKGQNGESLFAALSDVKYDGTGGLAQTINPLPQWIGEVWNATKYTQQFLPLFDHKDLTAKTITGFRWTTKPAGGDFTGNKGNVPSNTLVAAPVTATADIYGIGHDIAREFVDFNVQGFFESYAAAVSEDYSKWADNKVVTKVVAGATALTADALTTLPGTSGGTIGSAASAIVDGAVQLVTMGTLPDFALLAPALYKQMLKMPKANVLGYLSAALDLDEGDLGGFRIRGSASVPAGKVLVGAREAATVYELPGAPIRIDALDLARGGVDKAAFGYCGVLINDATGLQLVTAATV